MEALTAAAQSLAVAHVTRDRVVRVHGEDARSWLSGQVTADLRPLTAAHAIYALAVTVKGRIVTDLWVVAHDGLALVLPERCAADALAGFEEHIIMEDVELAPAPDLCVLSVQGPLSDDVIRHAGLSGYGAARLGEVGVDVWVPASEIAATEARVRAALAALGGGAWLDEAEWQALHVALAVPQAGVDFSADAYPQEAGLKARAVAFNKGCYLGQEVVYMLENRGQLGRRLVQLRGPAGIASGTPLVDAEGKRVGQITSWITTGEGQGMGLGFAKKPSWDVGHQLHAGEAVLHITHVVGAGSVVCPVVAS